MIRKRERDSKMNINQSKKIAELDISEESFNQIMNEFSDSISLSEKKEKKLIIRIKELENERIAQKAENILNIQRNYQIDNMGFHESKNEYLWRIIDLERDIKYFFYQDENNNLSFDKMKSNGNIIRNSDKIFEKDIKEKLKNRINQRDIEF